MIGAIENQRPYFRIEGVADYLQISVRQVRNLISTGELPSYKAAGVRRIKPEDVDAFMDRHRQERIR